jgi:predicted small metal-binding protein
MEMVFRCELEGLVVGGESEDELVAKVERHLAEEHPDLVGNISRDEILAMIDEKVEEA